MADTINTSIRFTPDIKKKLNAITTKDRRSQTQELFWLIERRHNELIQKNIEKELPDELSEALKKLKLELKEHFGQKFDRLILYGSYARGDYNNSSDVDLALILQDTEEDFIKDQQHYLAETDSRFFDNHGYMIKTLVFDKKTFIERADFVPYYSNIQKEGIIL